MGCRTGRRLAQLPIGRVGFTGNVVGDTGTPLGREFRPEGDLPAAGDARRAGFRCFTMSKSPVEEDSTRPLSARGCSGSRLGSFASLPPSPRKSV